MGQEIKGKRKLTDFARHIYEDQLLKMKQIQEDTHVPVADQVRDALDKALLLGKYKPE